MAENKLPSGVGKKIVQALKKQAEIEINPLPEPPKATAPDLGEQSMQDDFFEQPVQNAAPDANFDDFSVQDTFFEDTGNILNDFPTQEENYTDAASFEFPRPKNVSPVFEKEDIFAKPAVKPIQHQQQHTMPSNVAVLKRLIMQLPSGVTKQTGAQIIRQTMEALGISMNSVLKEAQQVQDGLNDSARDCLSTIQQYKANIQALEKQVQDYRKQALALNDLISLFILTDKNK